MNLLDIGKDVTCKYFQLHLYIWMKSNPAIHNTWGAPTWTRPEVDIGASLAKLLAIVIGVICNYFQMP